VDIEIDRATEQRLRDYLDGIGDVLGTPQRRAHFASYAFGLVGETGRKNMDGLEVVAVVAVGRAPHLRVWKPGGVGRLFRILVNVDDGPDTDEPTTSAILTNERDDVVAVEDVGALTALVLVEESAAKQLVEVVIRVDMADELDLLVPEVVPTCSQEVEQHHFFNRPRPRDRAATPRGGTRISQLSQRSQKSSVA
jgi:hypothetical protein